MRIRSRVDRDRYTGSYSYTVTLVKDGGPEEALINILEKLPKGRKTEFLRQRVVYGGGSNAQQPSSMGGFSLPSEGEKANKVNVKNILRNADEEIT